MEARHRPTRSIPINTPTDTADTPTNIYATLSPLWTDATLSDGALKATSSGSANYEWGYIYNSYTDFGQVGL
jgi:hypothetical protein